MTASVTIKQSYKLILYKCSIFVHIYHMEKMWFCLRIIPSQRHVLRVSMQYFEMIKDVLTGLDYSFTALRTVGREHTLPALALL